MYSFLLDYDVEDKNIKANDGARNMLEMKKHFEHYDNLLAVFKAIKKRFPEFQLSRNLLKFETSEQYCWHIVAKYEKLIYIDRYIVPDGVDEDDFINQWFEECMYAFCEAIKVLFYWLAGMSGEINNNSMPREISETITLLKISLKHFRGIPKGMIKQPDEALMVEVTRGLYYMTLFVKNDALVEKHLLDKDPFSEFNSKIGRNIHQAFYRIGILNVLSIYLDFYNVLCMHDMLKKIGGIKDK